MKARSFVAVRRVDVEQLFVSPTKSSPKMIDRPMTKERLFIVLSNVKWRCGNESKLDAQMAVGAAEDSCSKNGRSAARIKDML